MAVYARPWIVIKRSVLRLVIRAHPRRQKRTDCLQLQWFCHSLRAHCGYLSHEPNKSRHTCVLPCR
eukprot:3760509-Pleurochrysis_carterae.AAC.1